MGLFLDISVDAPEQALPGDLVDVTITVRNISQIYVDMLYAARYNGQYFASGGKLFAPGEARGYGWPFTMPDHDVVITAEAFRWVGEEGIEWALDDVATVSVSVAPAVPEPEYVGTISRKELEYDHVRSGIPVY